MGYFFGVYRLLYGKTIKDVCFDVDVDGMF